MTGVEIRLHDPDQVNVVGRALSPLLAGRPVYARDWRHANDTIIGVLQVQKDTMFIVLGMIVLVAAFNVVSSLIMLVKDKRADIAVLRTIGAGSFAVMRIFLMCGAFVGVSGTVIGTIIGVVFCHYIVAIQHFVETCDRRAGVRCLGVHVERVAEHHRLGRCRAGGGAGPGAVAAGDAVSKLAGGADRSGGGAAA